MALLEIRKLEKVYTARFSSQKTTALANIDFSVEGGQFVAIMGESGSGKTTLLNIISTLDDATSGEVYLGGKPLSSIRDKEMSAFRRSTLGFVFQDFNLLDNFSIRDNILLPLVLSRTPVDELEKRLLPIAENLGIADLLDKYPYEVSGGQKQRTAVARALITEPKLILADEPTGALDSKSSRNLMETLKDINSQGQTILMVTHSVRAASFADRVLFIRDGAVYHEIYRGAESPDDFTDRISQSLTVLSGGGGRRE
ncbi:ABC transporter ATP-binding protein [Indiicoccus explosivorum]|uniref:ABC transporter ATP-binding protein n=1 Tax=Indiicoccus explosivorum TaxID=1917864 RepID=UPI000B436B88|nr:ABC transporter ATP-binding protein [Indiicoccus explosivorum]